MGYYYVGTIKIFIILNLSIILIINLIKFIIKSKHKKIIMKIISIVTIILGIFFAYNLIYEKYLFENAIVMNVNDIITEFEENDQNAIKKYKGKFFEINGIIIYIARPIDFNPLWDASGIYFGDDNFLRAIPEGTTIECYFNDIGAVRNLKIGQEITVRCKFKQYFEYGMEKSIVFNKGKIIK
jgi:hypothetical protein